MTTRCREGCFRDENSTGLIPFVSLAILLAGFSTMIPTARSAETNAPTKDDKAAVLLANYRSDIVLIKSKTGSGSGFVFSVNGRKFLTSNAHVMADLRAPTFTPLDRTPLKLKPGTASVAVGHDIILLELQEGGNGIPRMDSFASEVAVNDPIAVYGNTGGGDVATVITGKLLGIGPNRIEISAEIEHGNSGSPIVHVPSGKVIGVATYATTDDLLSGETKIRRFGYRLDTVKQWQPVNWARFYSEADKLKKIQETTAELGKTVLELNGLNQRTNKVRVYAYESPFIRNALDDFYGTLHQAGSRREVDDAVDNLLGTLRNVSQASQAAGKSSFTYEYFRDQFTEQTDGRKEIMNLLVKILQK